MTLICPSILSADFANLASELQRVEDADMIHVDVMDGHFVPNLTIGAPVVAAISKVTDIPLDVHLMIENPERWVDDYIDAGADSVTFHVEAAEDSRALAEQIRSRGVRASASIKPGTPVEAVVDLLPDLDMVLVMTVEPGFGGQSLIVECLDKVRILRDIIDTTGADTLIQVDGGVSTSTIEECARAGADAFVAGSAVYGSSDPAQAVRQLRELAEI